MITLSTKNIIRWGIILVSLFIVSLILWNTFIFFQQFKEEERQKMEILAAAYQRLVKNTDLDAEISLEKHILDANKNIPMIVTDAEDNILFHANLNPAKDNDKSYLVKRLNEMKSRNKPIVIESQYIYYSDSNILTRLKYFPLGLLLVLFLFSAALYLYNYNNRIAAQNKLWTGMAKETAHQIGTPLTSLMGWATLLKENPETQTTALEMEKDVQRLEVIANRFSKIGSNPVLFQNDIVSFTHDTLNYLKSRMSNQVTLTFDTSKKDIQVDFNEELFSWVIENLVKNALDAMQGVGKISVDISDTPKHAIIKVCDTGKGIPKAVQKKIFDPGFTTKKRGWGLGLSLSKRIIEDFHGGKIFVLQSETAKGACFQINLPKR